MTPNRDLSSVSPFLLAGGIALLGCVLISGTLFFALRPQTSPAPATVAATRVRSFPTATILPSATPGPTNTVTPAPTNTPALTNTPVPPTNAPVTKNPPTLAPTNTVIPPTTVASATAHGLRVDYFRVEQTTYAAGSDIWFEFMVTNISAERVGWGYLGAYFADMNGAKIYYQASYAAGVGGDPKYWLQPSGQLTWRDHWKNNITTPGTYQVQLRICYDTMGECDGAGTGWENLSPFIQFTIT